jgi:hypothetical protein
MKWIKCLNETSVSVYARFLALSALRTLTGRSPTGRFHPFPNSLLVCLNPLASDVQRIDAARPADAIQSVSQTTTGERVGFPILRDGDDWISSPRWTG